MTTQTQLTQMNDCPYTAQLDEIHVMARELHVTDWSASVVRWHRALYSPSADMPSQWYLTDMRHLHNLSDPNRQDCVTEDMLQTDPDALYALADLINDFVEDHFCNDDCTYNEEGDCDYHD